jgi:hypothetical protein
MTRCYDVRPAAALPVRQPRRGFLSKRVLMRSAHGF